MEALKDYRWSSYPWYLKSNGRGPTWLRRERVFGAMRLDGNPRRGYQAYIEARVLELGLKQGRVELEEKWKALRRGWYVGGEGVFDQLKDKLEAIVVGRRRESHSGGAKHAHGESAAVELLDEGLAALGIRRADLPRLPKGAPEKTVLAWWLRGRTTVSLRWVGQKLAMGQYTRVTQAVSRMSRSPTRKLKQLKQRLLSREKRNA